MLIGIDTMIVGHIKCENTIKEICMSPFNVCRAESGSWTGILVHMLM